MSRISVQRTAAVAAIAVALLLILHLTGVLAGLFKLISRTLVTAAAPVRAAAVRLSAPFAERDCTEQGDATKEIENLRIENSRLRTLAAENSALKMTLDFRERGQDRPVMSRVVSESADSTFSGLVIDRGSDDDIMSGQPVVAGDGIMIGKVHSVGATSATVMLLTDSSSRLAVSVQGGTGTAGVLEGDRGLSMSISLIPQTERIAPGDVVVTSGLEPGVRRGLIVGTVESVQKDPLAPFQTATVVPFSDAERPVFVQVLVSEYGI